MRHSIFIVASDDFDGLDQRNKREISCKSRFTVSRRTVIIGHRTLWLIFRLSLRATTDRFRLADTSLIHFFQRFWRRFRHVNDQQILMQTCHVRATGSA